MISRVFLTGLALAAFLLAGCSRHSSQPAAAKSVNLGIVELSDGVASRHDLGGGSVCVLTARAMDATTIELIAVLEQSGEKAASSRRAPTILNQPLVISLGGTTVQVTPRMK